MYDYLINRISPEHQLSTKDMDLIKNSFEEISVSKNQILEEEGKIPRYLYLVVSGFVRLFYHKDGNEITTQINCHNGFITSFFDFSSQKKSELNVATVTDCDLLRITKPNLDSLIQKSENFRDYSIRIFTECIKYNEGHSNDLLSMTAEQRYLKLLKERPEIVQNVPLQIIASYIGVKPESLSRIRRSITT